MVSFGLGSQFLHLHAGDDDCGFPMKAEASPAFVKYCDTLCWEDLGKPSGSFKGETTFGSPEPSVLALSSRSTADLLRSQGFN